jgi:hypothetical protein
MTVVPVNVKSVLDEEKEAAKAAWRTAKGWSFPGHKTMIASNKHPMKLDNAREEELRTVSSVYCIMEIEHKLIFLVLSKAMAGERSPCQGQTPSATQSVFMASPKC